MEILYSMLPVAEMVRAYMIEKYGESAYHAGYGVTTTLDSVRQRAANAAVRRDLLAYDRRHGFRGPDAHRELTGQESGEDLGALLESVAEVGGLKPALVTALGEQSATVYIAGTGSVQLGWDALSWARKAVAANVLGPELKTAADALAVGDIVRVEADTEGHWMLAQLPQVAGALVSVRPQDGALQALVGGFDFFTSKFNRATQAQRQPGSSFKPFVYSAALAKGYSLASVFNDAPVVFDDASLETTWRPENYSGKFYGPTRMREALTHSRNLVSIRLLQAIGPGYAADYVKRFGFTDAQVPRDLSLALGSGSATPLEMARAYSVWANGGFYVEPYFIKEIRDSEGEVVFSANPPVACLECDDAGDADAAGTEPAPDAGVQPVVADAAPEAEPEVEPDAEPGAASGGAVDPAEPPQPRYARRVVDYDNVYLMTSMMQDVIKRGTGRRAMTLGRNDLAGKTGTTNDQRDAWFCGFNSSLVTTVWVGFDRVQPLGAGETGGRAALPMWIEYMKTALQDVPQSSLPQPPDLVTVRIDAKTGLRLPPGEDGGLFELFRPGEVPERYSQSTGRSSVRTTGQGAVEPLF